MRAGLLRRLLSVAASGLAVGTLLAAALGGAGAPAGASGPTVTGGGSSWIYLAMEQWEADVVSPNFGNLSINYEESSSVTGLNQFAQSQITFAASEIGYSTGQANYTPPSSDTYQYLPAVGGADCLMYNLTGVPALHVDSSVVTGIMTGTITSWDDPALQALNPGVNLPSSPITVVYRTEPAGDNYVLSDYIETLQPSAWAAYTKALGSPDGPQAIWPVPQGSGNYAPFNFANWIGQSGSDNASNYVAGAPGSITYAETGYALEHNLPCAQVENSAGNFVAPSQSNDAVALENDVLQPDLEQNLSGVFTSPQATAYPISAYGYMITQEAQTPSAVGSVLGTFIKFVACQGQIQAGQLGYTPLPPNLVDDDFAAIGRINGAADPGPVTSANCPNPYVTGTIAPTTGPVVIGQAPSGSGPAAAGSSGSSSGSATGAPGTAGAAGSSSSATSAGASGSTAAGSAGGAGSSSSAPGAALPGSPVGSGAKASGASVSSLAAVRAAADDQRLLSSAIAGRWFGVPTGTIAWGTLVFVLAVLALPAVLMGRRRRQAVPALAGLSADADADLPADGDLPTDADLPADAPDPADAPPPEEPS